MIDTKKLINENFIYREKLYKVNKFDRRKLKILVKSVPRDARVLEIGCGYGFLAQLLLSRTDKVWATDIVRGIAEKPLAGGVVFKKMKVGKLPFENKFFDCLISTDVIEHVEDDNAFLTECGRVLKKNGKMITMTPNRYRLSFWLKNLVLRKPKFPNEKRIDPIFGVDQHLREYDKKELRTLFDKKDWKKIKVQGYGFGLSNRKALAKLIASPWDFWCNYFLVTAKKGQ